LEGAELIKVMKERARRIIVLTDSSKYGRAGPVTIMPLSGADGIITGSDIPPEAAAEMRGDPGIAGVAEERDPLVTRFWLRRPPREGAAGN
jgi:DeoR/GlpR family transcriptional regulator of sugar metabolism